MMDKLFQASTTMQHCHVHKKVDRSCCFDMYSDETGAFIVGCAVDKSMSGKMLLTTRENSHRDRFNDLTTKHHSEIIALLSSDWLTGLTFSLKDSTNTSVCTITSVIALIPLLLMVYSADID